MADEKWFVVPGLTTLDLLRTLAPRRRRDRGVPQRAYDHGPRRPDGLPLISARARGGGGSAEQPCDADPPGPRDRVCAQIWHRAGFPLALSAHQGRTGEARGNRIGNRVSLSASKRGGSARASAPCTGVPTGSELQIGGALRGLPDRAPRSGGSDETSSDTRSLRARSLPRGSSGASRALLRLGARARGRSARSRAVSRDSSSARRRTTRNPSGSSSRCRRSRSLLASVCFSRQSGSRAERRE
jgi:hypothetical protein